MLNGITRALRFGWEWKTGSADIREMEVDIRRSDGTFPATLLIPSGSSPPLPGWVTLHGITRLGRKHPTLVRYVRALAASGAAVLVPEIPEWCEMLMAPREAADTLRSAILTLADREETASDRLGAMGFSFGGPPALMAGMDPDLLPHLKVVASFGGYCDLERTLHFLFSGKHDWKGESFDLEPDPYGRWVVGGNYISGAEGYEGEDEVAEALLSLARAAGDLQLPSWETHHEVRKGELEAALPPSRRGLFRAFAPPHGVEVPSDRIGALVPALTRAARRDSPLFDIAPHLPGLKVPVRLIHGRQDRLMPFTETLRLAEAFPPGADVRAFLTGLFSHSQRDTKKTKIRELGEQLWFLRIMSGVLGML